MGVGGEGGVLLPPARVQQHAVPVILVHGLHLLVTALGQRLQKKLALKIIRKNIKEKNYLIDPGRPGLDEQVEGGGDEGEADVLDNLGLVRGNGDGALLQINLKHQTQICSNTS